MTWPPDDYKHFSRWTRCTRCGKATVGGGLCADCLHKAAQEIRQLREEWEKREKQTPPR